MCTLVHVRYAVAWKQGFSLDSIIVNYPEVPNYNLDEQKIKSIEQLKHLLTKLSILLKKAVTDIEEKYYHQVYYMNHGCRKVMWDTKYANCLEHVHSAINDNFKDENSSSNMIEAFF
ncbi:conserved Plasmodium protein, unknown function [Plasmodium ovale wallikeri]|uniref:Uncharacterized protein n=1 Tax=Plasmodium ovale wallikeri TaxID=864142 RepID=A0A1A8ZS75_PLAOA|nr:conserved Plasmodium protein, unknown function [Plasmodium ovale wallikeri]